MKDQQTVSAIIAVADDDPLVRTTFVRLLQALGHSVPCVAANGEELVSQCNTVRVDLAFVDLDMPVMDGLAAAEIIAAMDIPVVLISGHPDAENIVLEQEPLVSRIRKPATSETLQRAIKQALSKHRPPALRHAPPLD